MWGKKKAKFPTGLAAGVGAGAAVIGGISYALYAKPQWRWALADLGRQAGGALRKMLTARKAAITETVAAVTGEGQSASLEEVIDNRLHSDQPANPEIAEAFREAIEEE